MAPNSVIVVLLNIGHKASHMPVPEFPFTHDWSAYVQGADGIDIKHFVEKVVFRLHETFTNPIQTRTEPPYMISEKGYASFGLTLEVVFQNSVKPNHIMYEYDLVLPGEGQPPVKYFRQEKLIFRNPPDDFRQKLLRGGAHETDPEAKEELRKEREKKAKGEQKQSDEEKPKLESDPQAKKKKDKSKPSKHKRADTDKSAKESKPSSVTVFGLPRSREDKKSSKTRTASQSSSSSSGSEDSSSPPAAASKAKDNSSSGSSSGSDDEQSGNKTNNNNMKRSPGASSIQNGSAPKRSKGEKDLRPVKKSERSTGMVRKAPNGVPLEVLLDLHEKMKECATNQDLLQRFVDLVEESGQFKITDTTFDFDLCLLDSSVIHKLEALFK